MSIGITILAYSISTASKSAKNPITLSHAQQFVAALFGYKSLASYQAAVKAKKAPEEFDKVKSIIVDENLLSTRHAELDCGLSLDHLKMIIGNVFEEKLPDVQRYRDFDEYFEGMFEDLQYLVQEDASLSSEMGLANFDGVDEVYFDYDPQTLIQSLEKREEIVVLGKVTLGIDIGRPYSGHIINFEMYLDIDNYGDRFFGDTIFKISNARLNQNWDGYIRDDRDEAPIRTLAEVYAELTGLDIEDAEMIADVEAEALSSQTGEILTGYTIDFSDIAFPEIKAKILKNKGTLIFHVNPNFFDHVIYFE